jgi:hypothetical protein
MHQLEILVSAGKEHLDLVNVSLDSAARRKFVSARRPRVEPDFLA